MSSFRSRRCLPSISSVSKRLHEWLLVLQLPGVTVRHEGPLTLRDSEPLPDLAMVAGSDSNFSHRHPTTAERIIEVAVSSVAKDREMAALSAEAGVKEYWIVLPEEWRVEAH